MCRPRAFFPPLLLAGCPLPCPDGPAPRLPALPDGLLSATDAAHVATFRLPGERRKRHLARLLLAVLLRQARTSGLSAAPGLRWLPLPRLAALAAQAHQHFRCHACPGLERLPSGRPLLADFSVSFSYSETAVFCALGGPGQDLGMDAEALTSPAPPASAFAAREIPAAFSGPAGMTPAARQDGAPGLPACPPRLPSPNAVHRDRLRRWTIKEAVFKAAGTGCDRAPHLLDSGHGGQWTGRLTLDAVPFLWRLLPCPGHWLCVAVRAQRS